jgi:hypothetical protein
MDKYTPKYYQQLFLDSRISSDFNLLRLFIYLS